MTATRYTVFISILLFAVINSSFTTSFSSSTDQRLNTKASKLQFENLKPVQKRLIPKSEQDLQQTNDIHSSKTSNQKDKKESTIDDSLKVKNKQSPRAVSKLQPSQQKLKGDLHSFLFSNPNVQTENTTIDTNTKNRTFQFLNSTSIPKAVSKLNASQIARDETTRSSVIFPNTTTQKENATPKLDDAKMPMPTARAHVPKNTTSTTWKNDVTDDYTNDDKDVSTTHSNTQTTKQHTSTTPSRKRKNKTIQPSSKPTYSANSPTTFSSPTVSPTSTTLNTKGDTPKTKTPLLSKHKSTKHSSSNDIQQIKLTNTRNEIMKPKRITSKLHQNQTISTETISNKKADLPLLTMSLANEGHSVRVTWNISINNLDQVQGFLVSYKMEGREDYDSSRLGKKVRIFILHSLHEDKQYTICVQAVSPDDQQLGEICQGWSKSSMKIVMGIIAGSIFLLPCLLVVVWVVYTDTKMKKNGEIIGTSTKDIDRKDESLTKYKAMKPLHDSSTFIKDNQKKIHPSVDKMDSQINNKIICKGLLNPVYDSSSSAVVENHEENQDLRCSFTNNLDEKLTEQISNNLECYTQQNGDNYKSEPTNEKGIDNEAFQMDFPAGDNHCQDTPKV